jgi:hypothetical protein
MAGPIGFRRPALTPVVVTVTDMEQMAEMGAIRCFMDWGAFDLIPQDGSIAYKDLAEKLEAEESLVGRYRYSRANE